MDLAANLGGIAVGLAVALVVPHSWRQKLDRVLGRPEGVV
jgi:hypothetical protein